MRFVFFRIYLQPLMRIPKKSQRSFVCACSKNTNIFVDLPVLKYLYSLFRPTTTKKDIYIYIYIYISKVTLVTVVEGYPKVPFSIATTRRCRGGRYSFPWFALLYPWYVPYTQGAIKYHFFYSLVYTYIYIYTCWCHNLSNKVLN